MPVAKRAILADIRPLREYPDYRRLRLGTALSTVGGQMTTFAVALQVLRISHSSAAVGAVRLSVAVPLPAFVRYRHADDDQPESDWRLRVIRFVHTLQSSVLGRSTWSISRLRCAIS
jgi:hypothetical protein